MGIYAAIRRVSPATRAAFVQLGGTKISLAPGNRAMTGTKNGKSSEVALPVAPVLVSVVGNGRALYVPLAAKADELGLPFAVNPAKHRFRLGR